LEGALSNIRVIDLSRILAGPYCTMLLADYGAEVIKIEQPGSGDGTRQWGPPWIGGESAYYMSANRNKYSLTVDLKTPEGRTIVTQLASRADVLVENFKPGGTKKLGLDYETLAADNPGLVYCSITGYGQTGPYRERPGYDFIIQAEGGLMSITGPADGEPHKVGVAIVDITSGLFAANAILAALHERERSGRGQFIDVALLDSQIGWLANVAHNYFAGNQPPRRYGNAHPNIVPYETFPTAGGYIALAIGSDAQFQHFCRAVERPDLWTDERFQTNAGRVNYRQDLVARLQALFRSRPTEAWLELLHSTGIPAAPINDIPTILGDPHVAERAMVQEVKHPRAGTVKLLGPVAKLSRTPALINRAPPLLGADTERVLREQLGYSADEIESLRQAGAI
jgi:crotonobetainyl-CoA:carnitine CoA-transferase CaiB-like acyl-CoA transferase